METITEELLKQDKEYFTVQLEHAQKQLKEVSEYISRLDGILFYNNQLLQFLDQPTLESSKEE